jgi:hypothetical protein
MRADVCLMTESQFNGGAMLLLKWYCFYITKRRENQALVNFGSCEQRQR